MSATLQFLSGPEAGRLYEFGETEIVIGRDHNCYLVLDKPEISRKHASVYFQDDRHWLKRSGRNLTHLNGLDVEKDTPVALADGDQIGICDWLMEFRCALPLADNEAAGDSSSISSSLDACLDAESVTQINPAEKLRVMLRISEALGRTLDTQALLTNMIDGLLEIFPRADQALV